MIKMLTILTMLTMASHSQTHTKHTRYESDAVDASFKMNNAYCHQLSPAPRYLASAAAASCKAAAPMAVQPGNMCAWMNTETYRDKRAATMPYLKAI